MMKTVLLSALCALTVAKNATYTPFVGKINPDTVDTLDVSKYLGLWYQMSADQIVYSTFEKDAYCATAQYGLNSDGTISVHNYATIGSPAGSVYTIDGYAYQTDATNEPGRLKVVFNSDDAAPFPAPYWVLELGPINADGLYDYAIVSDNLSAFLFVLARDVNTFNSKYKASVSTTLTKLGFTGKTAPIDTYQGSDCVYESTLRKHAMTHSKSSASRVALDTVDTLNVDAYMGLWYQVYGDRFVLATTSKGSYCATAQYALKSDGTISVLNSENLNSPTGEISDISGYAYIRDASEPGQLGLYLEGVPVEGSYWILALGPIVNNAYEWSVVSDPTGISLYILARDSANFKAKYEATVLDLVASLGFTEFLTAPIAIYQGSDCAYNF